LTRMQQMVDSNLHKDVGNYVFLTFPVTSSKYLTSASIRRRVLPYIFHFILPQDNFIIDTLTRESKTIHVTGRGGPWSCETSRLAHFLDIRLTDDGEVVSITRQAFSVRGRGGP
jgi:hypothetical protein